MGAGSGPKLGLTMNFLRRILHKEFGGVAQLVERDNRTVEARSSSLLTSTKIEYYYMGQ